MIDEPRVGPMLRFPRESYDQLYPSPHTRPSARVCCLCGRTESTVRIDSTVLCADHIDRLYDLIDVIHTYQSHTDTIPDALA